MLPEPSNETSSTVEILPPQLHVEWSSRSGVFFRNLGDAVFPRSNEPLETTSEPNTTFWRSVFIQHPPRLRFIFDSYATHVLFLLIVYGLSTSPLFQRRPQLLRDPFANMHIEYYPVSPYLPPVATAPKPAKHPLQGQPALASQEIISVPPEPDNSRQTIVTPDLRVIKRELPLPNIVVWGEKAAPIQPAPAMAAPTPPKLLLPPDVIPPPPEELPRSGRVLQPQQPDVIKPAVEIPADAKARLPAALAPSVIEPPPSAAAVHRRAGAINLVKLGPDVVAPKLPAPEQRSPGAPGGAAPNSSPALSIPAAPSLQGVGSGMPQGRMLVLSVQPAEGKGPIEVPQGSRKGIFAAGPEGKVGAPGTPTVPGGGTADLGAPGRGSASAPRDPLEGVYVGPAPAPKTEASRSPDPNLRNKLLAAMKPAKADLPHLPPATGTAVGGDTHIENRVFGSKKFYSMVLNMPNLTSSVGSWIIRYAELAPSLDKTDLSAPVALNKVDPAYPAELIRDQVEGTVVLYAVIRSDGTIDGIRVLESGDERLNPIAMRALSRWRFRPGTKQGVAIDIEAVVQVPFRIKKWRQ